MEAKVFHYTAKTLLLLSFIRNAYAHEYCVTPNATMASAFCSQNNCTECYELDMYVRKASFYFQSNSQFTFLPGTHLLTVGPLNVENCTNIILKGYTNDSHYSNDAYIEESTIMISCENSSGFVFVNVSNLIISELGIANCGYFYSLSNQSATFHMFNIFNLVLNFIYIQNSNASSGCSLLMDQITTFFMNNSYFDNTSGVCINTNTVNNVPLNSISITNCIFKHSLMMQIGGNDNAILNNSTFMEATVQCICPDTTMAKVSMNSIISLGYSASLFTNCILDFEGMSAVNSYLNFEYCNMTSHSTTNGIFLDSSNISMIGCTSNDTSIMTYNSVSEISYSNFTNTAVSTNTSTLTMGDSNFNYCNVLATDSSIFIHGVNVFSGNIVQPRPAIMLTSSSVLRVASKSNITFKENYALLGGALYLDSSSILIIAMPTRIHFINNTAFLKGGAIFVENTPQSKQSYCFFQINSTIALTKSLFFEGNSAQKAGSVLYGGNIDGCILNCDGLPEPYQNRCQQIDYNTSGAVFDVITSSEIQKTQTNVSNISSDPCTAILCGNNTNTTFSIYRGQSLMIPVETVGQRNGTCPTGLSIYDTEHNSMLNILQTTESCTSVNVSIYSSPYIVTNQVSIQPQPSCTSTKTIRVSVQYKQGCPPGFTCTGGQSCTSPCVCVPLLTSKGIECNLDKETFLINSQVWIGNLPHSVIAYCTTCPFDYCSTDRPASVGLNDIQSQNLQCSHNRGNVLCGKCTDGLSVTLGTSNCRQCPNYWIALVLVFAIMGIALLVFLFITNLTVSSGTLNGLVFYANIIRINDSIFFPDSGLQSNSNFAHFLQIFIAWTNIDFGIETCFYHNMDNYAKAWLQFVFPTYILMLVVVFIVMGRYFSIVSNVCRHNAVPVLATLFYLSYAKMIQTAIIIFSPSKLELSDSTTMWVWQYDGNIEYGDARHAPLLVFGLIVAVVFIIPYTGLILLSPCLQSLSHWRFFGWVNKLKPFLDCYQASFKDKYRYWIGVLLVIRIGLYVAFILIPDSYTRLGVIIVVVMLYTIGVCALSVYKDWSLQMLEVLFLLNLTFLSLSSYQNVSYKGTAAQLLVGSAFVTFVCLAMWQLLSRYSYLCKATTDRIKGFLLFKTKESRLHNTTPIANYGARNCTTALDLDMYRETLLDDGDDVPLQNSIVIM